MSHMVEQCKDLYQNGLDIPNFGTVRLVPISLEGDLPAQAKLFHCKRNFNCQPNKLCTWCDAQDGGQYPYTDFSATASWITTISMERPWTNWSPMTGLPGAQDETFLSKDVFHLCHLGVCRYLTASILCYMVAHEHFNVPNVPFLHWYLCSSG